MTRSKKRKRKRQRPGDLPATSGWGNFEEALTTVDTLDAESLEQVCAEVTRLAQLCIAGLPNDDEEYPLPPVIIALSGYFETLALSTRNVWLRETAGEGVTNLDEAKTAGVMDDLRKAMRVSAAWRVVGALMGQKQEGDEDADKQAEVIFNLAQAVQETGAE